MSIWKKDQKIVEYNEIEKSTDNFFEQIRGSKILEYREGQHTMALDVVDAMKNKEILLIEAGVGIGKSYAYIIPILYTLKKDKGFNGFIISTSTIALQEQIKEDIETAAKMLNIDIDVKIAKGKSNYICRRRLEFFLESSHRNQKKYKYILDQLADDDIEDRNKFDKIDSKVWEKIKITSCDPKTCTKALSCQYILHKKSWMNKKAIICNHDLLIDSLRKIDTDDERLITDPSILIIDEAHTLESKVRNAYQKNLNNRKITSLIYKVYEDLTMDNQLTNFNEEIINSLNNVFKKISIQAKREFENRKKYDIDYEEVDRHSFKITKSIKEAINTFLEEIDLLLQCTKKYQELNSNLYYQKNLNELINIISIISDIKEDTTSKNIYWIEFDDANRPQITYVPKNISELTAYLLSDPSYAKVLTSATLTDDKKTYNYFSKNTGIDLITGLKVFKEFPINSSYDYNNNTLAYIDNQIVSPRCTNHDKYIDSIAQRIEELIDVTDGKALVLFTSKKDMYKTYKQIIDNGTEHKIILQSENKSSENIKEEFAKDENSSLFATGTFWEGIDVKGRSLSNVIITKLPFPVVDPITKEKENHTTKSFEDIYLPEMIMRLKQGVGRLIRSSTDTGIIAILDSRVQEYNEKYNNIIFNNLPTENITSNIEKVKEFAKKKGIKKETEEKPKIYYRKEN